MGAVVFKLRTTVFQQSQKKKKKIRVLTLHRVAGRDSVSHECETEEVLETKSGGSGLENRQYGRRDPSG
jgi:hypothetical protein